MPTYPWNPWFAVPVLVMTAGLGYAAPQAKSDEPNAVPVLTQTLAVPYWLNEDVVYIIDDAERTAFLKLTTDEERDKFIEQFWLRRDPTPGSEKNEFREEHYRRIGYTNRHFRSARPGWRTDRGHMYIVYGPPDEIESHPRKRDGVHSSGPPPQFASEVWLYRHIDGVGENVTVTFIDRSGSGDWCLAPSGSK
jgi:GWxTD domain-containing protein